MAKRQEAQKWMENVLGKKGATALLSKVEKMAKRGVPTTKIEKEIEKQLASHIRRHVPRLANIVADHIVRLP